MLAPQWRGDDRGLAIDGAAWRQAPQARAEAALTPLNREWLVTAAQRIEKAAFTRADLIEVVGAQLPVDTEHSPRALVESAVDHVGVRLTASRQPHQREGHERFTLDAIDPEHNRIAARRFDDDARAAFTGDYLSEHITHGYAVTVHSAQGVTADTTQAVLGENTTRAMAYVAMTRGRESNTVYLYRRTAGDADHEHTER
ncbi:MAG: hypothetical protein ACJ74F_06730 [Mycobacterium sp.]|uniref:hypothetical protein n=1 Tax=Mycobacterium sp. TaxID=1785 RepID=UPI00389AE07A